GLSRRLASILPNALGQTPTHKKFSRLARVSDHAYIFFVMLLLGHPRSRQALLHCLSTHSRRFPSEEFPIAHARNYSILRETVFFGDLRDLSRGCNAHLIANHLRSHI